MGQEPLCLPKEGPTPVEERTSLAVANQASLACEGRRLQAWSRTKELRLPLTKPPPQLFQHPEILRLGFHPPMVHKPLWGHPKGHPPKSVGHRKLYPGSPCLLPQDSLEPLHPGRSALDAFYQVLQRQGQSPPKR